jgi:hypothetical protein
VSNAAIDWAMKLRLDKSSVKFVLVCLANRANENTSLCFPSIKQLEEETCQDRKTVIANLRELCRLGLIEDTSERVGATRQIIVYRVLVGSSPKTGTGSENGTVPVLESNSTVFTLKESRFSAETVPETVHGTQINPKEPKRNPHVQRSKPKPKRSSKREEPPEFSALRLLYPSRSGDQGWPQALKACHARLGEGFTWEQMAEGTRQYAEHVRAKGDEGTQWVKSAKTFFGPDAHFAKSWAPPPTRGQIRQDRNLTAAQVWLEQQEANDASH